MTDAAAVQAFIKKWDAVTVNERAVAQSHFNDLCALLGVKPPLEADPKGNFFRFEKPLSKSGGGKGFADVWYKDRFAWEYKTKGKYPNLTAAYQQLTLYRADLDNPPILVACDIANYEVHIEFTGFSSKVVNFTNADLQNADTRELLRQVLTNPEPLRPVERQATITEKAATRLADVARFLEKRGYAPNEIAHFFMKVLFALFAEDIKVLPAELMSQSIKQAIFKPGEFVGRVSALFRAMKTGDYFGMEKIPRFNGWLFNDDEVLPLNSDELTYLADAARLDWSQVEPAIFGTLFERSLDPSKRSQLGAHYTSRDDILLIVRPVLMEPLRREWVKVQADVMALKEQWNAEGVSANKQRQLKGGAEGMLLEFMERLGKVRVLDPACGSGNFLYVSLTELKDLEKEVWTFAGGLDLQQPELSVSPAQLYGIEKNPFAAELAQVVVWIGYLQWKRANGFYDVEEPILRSLQNIQCRDAILAVDLDGQPKEPEWPTADVIIGNPPFLGWYKVRKELGDTYAATLFSLYEGRVPGSADFVCYWFERARSFVEIGLVKRVGLLATNSISGGANRKVLDRIKRTGDIFLAWDDRPWILDGAAVRVAMIGFDDGTDQEHQLNGRLVPSISADLTGDIDLTLARRLAENAQLSFVGVTKKGLFDIPSSVAQEMVASPNSSGRANQDVLHPWLNASDIMRQPRGMWMIDFGVDASEDEAALYEKPYAYVQQKVKPVRDQVRNQLERARWWLLGRPAPDMRTALRGLGRYIATPIVAKHRAFVWLSEDVLPDHALTVVGRNDDYFFGVLHSKVHELWTLRMCTWLGVGNDPRYTPTTTFETYPFPWSPGKEDQADPRVRAIAEAARDLVRLRDEWLNPTDDELIRGGGKLKDRTLTNLYNKRPDWLDLAHKRLDAAVFDAYGWPHDLGDDEILARLLALNLERAAGQGEVAPVAEEDSDE
jgi:type II restriction/modification system DNA methylase subunit YeeA